MKVNAGNISEIISLLIIQNQNGLSFYYPRDVPFKCEIKVEAFEPECRYCLFGLTIVTICISNSSYKKNKNRKHNFLKSLCSEV